MRSTGFKKVILILSIGLLARVPVFAERAGDQGIGIMLGNPSGLSYKFWLNDTLAIDGAAGVDQGEFDVHTTLLFHINDWSKDIKGFEDVNRNGSFPLYFGIGPRLLFEHNEEFGIRMPIGLAYLPNNTVWEFFGEIAPVFRLTPDTGLDGDFAVGVRYYFPAVRPRG